MATKKSTKKGPEVDDVANEKTANDLRRLCDRTTGKMMRVWYQAELGGTANPAMFAAIKELSVAKKSFLAGSTGKKSTLTYLNKVQQKLIGNKAAAIHLSELYLIIQNATGMPAADFARLIDETRGHWLQDGPKAD